MQVVLRTLFVRCRLQTVAAVLLSVVLTCAVFAEENGNEGERLFASAAAAERQNNPAEAEYLYEQCSEFSRRNRLLKLEAAALHRIAVIKAQNKKFTESAECFRRAEKLDPKNVLILCDLAQLYADRKMYGDAESLLKKAFNTSPNDPKVLFCLGTVIASQQRGAERQAEGLRYLKLAVGEADAYRELARIYRSKGDLGQAEFAEQRAKLAEMQTISASASSDSKTGPVRSAPDKPVQRTHVPNTPAEIVERNRQELLRAESANIAAKIAAQQHPTDSPS
ncbi:MAG: hypothetical protein LBH00_04935, partial [Planctomycetaceae bacterium]|nr:hypothetical protein [Planctomycetaceae bacterium]